MYCDHCGSAVSSESKFCSACGGKIQASGISQPTAQRDFASDRRRGSSQSLQTIILISIPVLLLIVAGFWFNSGWLTSGGPPARIRELVFEKSEFARPITLVLPAEDDRKRFDEFSRAKTINATHIVQPFGLGQIRRDILNFLTQHGYAKVETVTVQKAPGWPFAAFAGPEDVRFLFYTEKLNPFIHEKSEGWPHGTVQIRVASRRLESIDYTNQYEGSPMGVKVKFYAVSFSYYLDEKLPGVPKVTKKFKGSAKAFLDPDTGQWALNELSLSDNGSATFSDIIAKSYDVFDPATMAVRTDGSRQLLGTAAREGATSVPSSSPSVSSPDNSVTTARYERLVRARVADSARQASRRCEEFAKAHPLPQPAWYDQLLRRSKSVADALPPESVPVEPDRPIGSVAYLSSGELCVGATALVYVPQLISDLSHRSFADVRIRLSRPGPSRSRLVQIHFDAAETETWQAEYAWAVHPDSLDPLSDELLANVFVARNARALWSPDGTRLALPLSLVSTRPYGFPGVLGLDTSTGTISVVPLFGILPLPPPNSPPDKPQVFVCRDLGNPISVEIDPTHFDWIGDGRIRTRLYLRASPGYEDCIPSDSATFVTVDMSRRTAARSR